MINDVKAFGQIKETEKCELLAVGSGKDMVGCGKECGFRREEGAEAVLG